MEVWLRPNRRILLVSLVPVAGIGATSLAISTVTQSPPMKWGAIALLALSAVMALVLARQLLRPRIAYRDGQVLFYLGPSSPIAVPVEVVEAFFLGQGPANLPGYDSEQTESVNMIARLSQKYPEWSQREVKRALGNWCDGYVTIRGTWCETLNEQTVRRLNRRLAEVSRGRAVPDAVAVT